MKKHLLLLSVSAALVLAFAGATYLYKSQRASSVAELGRGNAAPFVRDYAQSVGAPDAAVVISEFFDPGCETCKLMAPHVKDLVHTYEGKVRLVLRYAPLHHGSDTIVKILEAARLQGKYWETLDLLFATQAQWADHHQPQPEKIWEFLPTLGLDLERLRADMNQPLIAEMVRQDVADAQALGVRQTPEFFVNGKPLPSFGLPQLQRLVAAEVAANPS